MPHSGDPHARIAGFDELEPGSSGAHRLGGGSARLKLAVIELRLHQNELVLAAEVGELAAEQPGPGQRVRMAGDRIGHCLMKTA